jgi:hypothetical protein
MAMSRAKEWALSVLGLTATLWIYALAWLVALANDRGEAMNLRQTDVVLASTLVASLAFGWYRPRRYYLPGLGTLLFLLLLLGVGMHSRGASAMGFVQNEPWLVASPFLGALAGLAAARAERPERRPRRRAPQV